MFCRILWAVLVSSLLLFAQRPAPIIGGGGAGGGGGSGTVTSILANGGVEVQGGGAITESGTIRGAIVINAQTGLTYTVQNVDRGKLLTQSNGSASTLTLPQAGDPSFPDGWFFWVYNIGAGTATLDPTTSTINGAASLDIATDAWCFVQSDGTNYHALCSSAGGASTFADLGDGTALSKTYTVGNGSTLGYTGTGVIDARTVAGTTPGAGGLAVLDDATAADIRTTLGLIIGTNVQAFDADLSIYAGISPSANIQTFLGAADYAAMRTQLSLVVGTNVQAFDSDLSIYAGITPSANVQSILGAANYAAVRSLLSLEVGTNVQAWDADLDALAAIAGAQGDIIYRNASTWVRLVAGVSGEFLQTQGAGANPLWASPAGSGTVNSGAALCFAYYPTAAATVDDVQATTCRMKWEDPAVVFYNSSGGETYRIDTSTGETSTTSSDPWTQRSLNVVSATGNDTYAGTVAASITAYPTGNNTLIMLLDADTANTGAASINLNTIGAKPIYKYSDGTDLSDGDICVGLPALLVYDPGSNSGSGAFYLINTCNAPAGGGGYDTIQDEDSGLTQRTTLNFEGAGVTCADDTTKTTCTIPGGGGVTFDGIGTGTNTTATMTLGSGSSLLTSGTGTNEANRMPQAGIFITGETTTKIYRRVANEFTFFVNSSDRAAIRTAGVQTNGAFIFGSLGSADTNLQRVSAGVTATSTGESTACSDSNDADCGEHIAKHVRVSGNAYNATNWNGSDRVPREDDIRDQFEAEPAATRTLTNKTIDFEGTGNLITMPVLLTLPAANCQASAAFTAFATESSGAPAAGCVDGTNTVYGELLFDAASDEAVQTSFMLPPDWTGQVDLDLRWRAAATTGSVVWSWQTTCVAAGETGDPAFNAAQTVTDAALATTLQHNDIAQQTNITMTGCAAGEALFLKVFRDADNGSDDMTGDAGLLFVRLTIRRAM